jgi:hypothetical protein
MLFGPGTALEVETVLIERKVLRVYKNLPPSLRELWLAAVKAYANKSCVVYYDSCLTYNQLHTEVLKAAGIFSRVLSISRGLLCSDLLRN